MRVLSRPLDAGSRRGRPPAWRAPGAAALLALALTAALAQPAPAPTASSTGFEGLWRTPDKSVIEIAACPTRGHLCGYIRWAREGGVDEANPQEALRKRPICGLPILELHRYDGSSWREGWVYDPEEGKTYQAALRKRDGKLFLRGFVGAEVFGETETWTPVASLDSPCKP
ncbi:DUF2147 domain-containing protein [Pelomonas sp. CA6]|uniref:DUF2147 domain-containing protein n=1 Tax=Pelomonas sp. CA6 TaxID=2907999 RepID=UPI001F4C4270|nr:DUF2147 domain-containing protein [Pelomonas sp. CA6]MCH7343158.1 DUF2147 domain-containing protein [Pelomonas sp. CA6]